MFKYAGESISSCSTTTTSPPGTTASKSTSPFTTRKANGFTVFCLTHRWNRALFMQTGPSFRLSEESQRCPKTSNRTLVETPASTSFKCRLHHGTSSSPLPLLPKFKHAGESISSCSTTTTSPPGSIASKSTSPFTTSKANGVTDFCLTHRWNRALFMQADPRFCLSEESQRNPGTSNRTLVETPAWTSFKCRLHHGTCSSPLLWYQCKQVAGLA